MKAQLIACLVLLALAYNSNVEARPKRSVIYASAPVVAAATVPLVTQTHVVHSNPTSVVKTEQVRSGDHSSYSYSSEVKTEPIVHTHTHAAVAAAPVVATTHHAVAHYPAAYYAHYPAAYSYYSPYSYVIGK